MPGDYAIEPPLPVQQRTGEGTHPKVVAVGITTCFNKSLIHPREKNWKMMIPGAELQDPKWDDTQSL